MRNWSSITPRGWPRAKTRPCQQLELALYQAKLAKAKAKAKLAQAELNFTTVEHLSTGLSASYASSGQLDQGGGHPHDFVDNSAMRVYFNVPEARYLDYMAELGLGQSQSKWSRV